MNPNRKMMSMHDDPPILICADLQIEYITEGRRHVIADAEAITSRCLELMTLWRSNLWPIIHLKRIAQAAWFNPASETGRAHLRTSAAVGLQLDTVRRIHDEYEEHSLRAVGVLPR